MSNKNRKQFRVTRAPLSFTNEAGEEKKTWPTLGVAFQNPNSIQVLINHDVKAGERIFLFLKEE